MCLEELKNFLLKSEFLFMYRESMFSHFFVRKVFLLHSSLSIYSMLLIVLSHSGCYFPYPRISRFSLSSSSRWAPFQNSSRQPLLVHLCMWPYQFNCCILCNRGGQFAAREPHAALWRIICCSRWMYKSFLSFLCYDFFKLLAFLMCFKMNFKLLTTNMKD